MNRKSIVPSVLETNIFYFVIGIIFILASLFIRIKKIFVTLAITEYLIILLPTLIYIRLRGYNFKRVLKLNKISFLQGIIIPFIAIFAYPVGLWLNYIMIMVLSNFTEIKPSPIPIPKTGQEFLISFIIIAVSAGICEEVMFRGLVMKAYEKFGVKYSIIASGILFGFFHFNIQNLLGPIFLGMLFGYLVYKTNSIFASVIAHTTNNALAMALGFASFKFGWGSQEAQQGAQKAIEALPDGMVLLSQFIGVTVIAGFFGASAFGLIMLLPKGRNSLLDTTPVTEITEEKNFNLSFIPLIPIGLIFIYFTYRYIIL